MNNNLFVPQSISTPRQSSLPLVQPPEQPPQPAEPDYPSFGAVAQHPQQSHVQVPPAPAYNPQWTVPPPSWPPLPDQSVFDTNHHYGPQWQTQQHEYQQHQNHVMFPVAQQPLQLAAQPSYNPYQPTAGYSQQYFPQPVASPHPQLPHYAHLQPQQPQLQKRLLDTPLQHLMPEKRRRIDSHDLNRQVQHHAPQSLQPQFRPFPVPAQNPWVYDGQNQGSGHGDGDGWVNNAQVGVNRGGAGGNHGGMSGSGRHGGARGRLISGNRGIMAGGGRGGSYMDFGGGGRRCGQPSGGDHELGGSFDRVASTEAEGCSPVSSSAEPAAVPVATLFHGAQDFSISGNPWFANIGNLTTVNKYGGTHGLENLKEFFSSAALYDSYAQDPNRQCHPGTRERVLTQLRGWIDNSNSTDRIFWLHGPAGAGKSAIAQSIAKAYKLGEVAATFFFHRSDPSRNNGNRLFPTIVWQLAFSIPATKVYIIHALDKTPHLPTKAVEPQFEQLIARPFQAMDNFASRMPQPDPVVIIDGIDECSDEQLQRRILTVIGNAVKDGCVPLRFLICSRPEALIDETLNKFKKFTISVDLAKLDDSNSDVQKYLVDQFSDIASKHGLDPTWPGQEIIDEIVLKSSGNFIFASTVIRFVSDDDYSAQSQLDIIRNLKPRGSTLPFALLDELYLEILKRQPDQDFLKTFLALLVGRSFIKLDNLSEDDATLMKVSKEELHIKLRKMRSLFKFEPYIDLYHKSFLDFLQDYSRSGQYHANKQSGQKRYLELIVDSVVRHVSMAIEQPDCHRTCHSSPKFKSIVTDYPPAIVLNVEDWQEALKPLVDLQDKLLNTLKPLSCRVAQAMRDLLLQLVVLQRKSNNITAAQALESTKSEIVVEWSAVLATGVRQSTPDSEKDLDRCLSVLLSCLQKPLVLNTAIMDLMSSLLAFDYTEVVARVRSVLDAQKLIDFIDLLTNNGSFFSQWGPDAARKAAFLASEIFIRAPLLPQFISNGPISLSEAPISLEFLFQSVFISRILDHNYIIPVSWIYYEGTKYRFDCCNANEQIKSVHEWLEKSSPDFVTKIGVMLEVAKTVRYIHSMDITLYSRAITKLECIVLDSNHRVKVLFIGLFAWWIRGASIYGHEAYDLLACTYESNVYAFADLFDSVCFSGHDKNLSNCVAEDAKRLIDRCRMKDFESQPTMEEVVKEMETWVLI